MAVKKKSKPENNFLNFINENRVMVIAFAVFVGLIGILMYFSNQNKIDYGKFDLNKIIEAPQHTGEIKEHILEGEAKNHKAVLIEYGDYQCPSCATMHNRVQSLANEYKDKVTVIFRNFPLDGHPNALSAAAAAEAAGLQGKFKEMHHLLFEKQNEWGPSSISERNSHYENYAKELGLDVEKFKEDMKSQAVADKIKFDKATGKELKATGTPTFILNGKNIGSNIWGDEAEFKKEIDSILK